LEFQLEGKEIKGVAVNNNKIHIIRYMSYKLGLGLDIKIHVSRTFVTP